MLKTIKLVGGLFFLALFLTLAVFGNAHAVTCTPGIPCTGYDIYTNTNAATAPTINGPKSDQPVTSGQHGVGACDANFMNQIYSRAFMEANREVIMSQQIIHKPDSVLEYTCFDKFVSVAANNIDNVFSATTDWEDRDVDIYTADSSDTETLNLVFPDDQLDNLLEILVLEDLETYITSNFSHTFMGEAISIDNDMSFSSIGSGNYTCTHMGTIWNMAKCIDFGEDDKFRSFEHLTNFDPRSIPLACPAGSPTTSVSNDSVTAGSSGTKLDSTNAGESLSIAGISVPGLARMPSGGLTTQCPAAGGPVSGLNTSFSNDLVRVANNCDISDTQRNAYSRVDLMSTYTELTKGLGAYLPGVGNQVVSGNISGVVTCAPPIPTGVPVLTYVHEVVSVAGLETAVVVTFIHYDHICPNPGCYYQPNPPKGLYDAGDPLPTGVDPGFCIPFR